MYASHAVAFPLTLSCSPPPCIHGAFADHVRFPSKGLVALKDLIFHKPATRSVCIPSVLRFTHHSDNDVRTKAVRLAANLLWKDPAFQPIIETFAKQVGCS